MRNPLRIAILFLLICIIAALFAGCSDATAPTCGWEVISNKTLPVVGTNARGDTIPLIVTAKAEVWRCR